MLDKVSACTNYRICELSPPLFFLHAFSLFLALNPGFEYVRVRLRFFFFSNYWHTLALEYTFLKMSASMNSSQYAEQILLPTTGRSLGIFSIFSNLSGLFFILPFHFLSHSCFSSSFTPSGTEITVSRCVASSHLSWIIPHEYSLIILHTTIYSPQSTSVEQTNEQEPKKKH